MVPRGRIELPTQGFSVLCSTDWATEPDGCEEWIWTNDLQVMSLASYRAALPRDVNGAEAGIRTQAPVSRPTGFQDRTLQPLGYFCICIIGGPCRTRTYDPPVMSRMLWPTALRVHICSFRLMVAEVGVEPTTFRVWTGCSSQLSYPAELNKIMVGMTGFEPATPWSQIKCTTKLCYIPIFLEKK